MKDEGITILTEPINFFQKRKNDIKKFMGRDYKYGGHKTVTKNLIEGLTINGTVKFNYRPSKKKDIYSRVHVLAGVKTLEYAIALKKEGIIQTLSAGPNIVTFSTDYNSLIADENIDLIIVPSKWVADLYVGMEPKLKNRCKVWSSGVDINTFKSKLENTRNQVLIYNKMKNKQLSIDVCDLIVKNGYNAKVLNYGEYTLKEYCEELEKSKFMISLSESESQGIFLAEAWSMGVPTLCFDPGFAKWEYEKIVEIEGELLTCPLLTEDTGMKFKNLKELSDIIQEIRKNKKKFIPREWVQNNLTLESSAKQFYDLIMSL